MQVQIDKSVISMLDFNKFKNFRQQRPALRQEYWLLVQSIETMKRSSNLQFEVYAIGRFTKQKMNILKRKFAKR